MGLFSWAKGLASRREASGSQQRATDQGDKAPTQSSGPTERGIALLADGDAPGACAAFREALLLNPHSAANRVNLAYALQQTGEEPDALPLLQQAVEVDPQSFDAHYMLAGVLERISNLPAAAEHLRRAIAVQPGFEMAHADLCRVLTLEGDTVGAREAILAAIALNPDRADSHHYLGNLCMAESDPQSAIESYARALELQPAHSRVHANMGLALYAQKRFDEAVECFERSIAIDPKSGESHAKLGLTHKAQGRLDEAKAAMERSLELQPDNAETLNNLGIVLQEQGHLARAVAIYRRAISLRPDLPGGYANLGLALYEQGDVAHAVATYRQGLAIRSIAEMHDNLAIALQKQGAVDEAIEHYHRALALQPDNLNTRCNLAAALAEGGGPKDAIAAYREILAVHPQHLVAHSNLLFNLAVDETASAESYLAEARRFDRKLTDRPLEPVAVPRGEHNRRLRIGFVSGDLRIHPVGYFLEGILQHIDPNRFELFAYPTVAKEDELSTRIKPRFSRWRLIKGQSDEAAARAIRSDRIDILIDLAGHTGDNRLPVFGFKPAPVQVSWLGYFASTGVTAMDYVIADDVCVPTGNDHLFSEKICRLPQTRLCFTPPADGSTPNVSTLPALARGHITFGCFQRLPKINDSVLALWSQVFDALPNAHILLQSHQTGRKLYVDEILSRFERAGISAERVTVRGPAHRSAYLHSYAEVDMVLDTFPYTGGTTTCEALWMGVPTLTLSGESMIARQGVAMMTAAGLGDWVATSPREYVRKAVAFGSDLAGLADLRGSMRNRLPSTPLFDVRRFSAHLEEALMGMWQTTIERKGENYSARAGASL